MAGPSAGYETLGGLEAVRHSDILFIFKPLMDEIDVLIERYPASEAVEYRKLVSAYIDLYIKKLSLIDVNMITNEEIYNLMRIYATCMRRINSEIQSDYKSKFPLSMIFDLINGAIILRK